MLLKISPENELYFVLGKLLMLHPILLVSSRLWNSIDSVQTIFDSFQIPEKVTVANFDTASGIWKLQWWRPTQDHQR